MTKKTVSVLLILIMVFSDSYLSPVSARVNSSVENARQLLESLGVTADVQDPDQAISREEFAVLMAQVFRIDAELGTVRYFRDVENDGYAVGAINALTTRGVISLPEDRMFHPQDAILYEEVCKLIVYGLNYSAVAEERGGFPVGYVRTAAGLDITGGTVGGAVTYKEAFSILWQALQAELPEFYSVNGDGHSVYTVEQGNTLLSQMWNIYETEGTLEAVYGRSLYGREAMETNQVLIDGELYLLESDVDITDLFGSYVRAYYRKKKSDHYGTMIFAADAAVKKSLLIRPERFESLSGNTLTYDGDTKSMKAELSNPQYVYNGMPLETGIQDKMKNINKGSITLKDSDNDNRYDAVLIWDYTNFVVSSAVEGVLYNRLVTGDTIEQGEYRYERIISENGLAADYDTITAGQVLAVAQDVSKTAIEVITSSAAITGQVAALRSRDGVWYLTVGGVEYPVEKSYSVSVFGSDGQKQSSLIFSKTYEFKLDCFGSIAYMTEKGTSMKSGCIIQGTVSSAGFSENVLLQVLTESGVFEEMTLADNVRINGTVRKEQGSALLSLIYGGENQERFIRYSQNDAGEISGLQTAAYDQTASYAGEAIRAIYDGISEQWYNNARFGVRAVMRSTTPVFMIPYGNDRISEDDCAILTYSSLWSNSSYYGNAYSFTADAVAADAVVVQYRYSDILNNIDANAPLIMFSGVSEKVNDDGDVVKVLSGYSRGAAVEYEIPDSISLDGIEEGDLIMMHFGIKGKVVEGSKNSADDVTVVCKVWELLENNKPGWTGNSYHDYLYAASADALSGYYRADFQLSYGFVTKVTNTFVAWSYDREDKISESANITGNIVIYDNSRKAGERIYIGNTQSLITYSEAGAQCGKIIYRTRNGAQWETFVYQ